MLDSQLANDILGDEKIYQHFPRRMKAELDFGQEFAESGGFTRAIEVGQSVLSSKLMDVNKEILARFDKVSDKRLPAFEKPYLNEIRGWYNLTERRNYLDAANCFSDCIRDYEKLKVSNQSKR